MAIVTVTAANVIPPADAKINNGTAGETLTAGMLAYLKTSGDRRWYKADCLTLEKSGGIDVNNLKFVLNDARVNQPVSLLAPGQDITIGGGLLQGRSYSVSPTGGAFFLTEELVNGNYPSGIGIAKSTSVLAFYVNRTGVPLA